MANQEVEKPFLLIDILKLDLNSIGLVFVKLFKLLRIFCTQSPISSTLHIQDKNPRNLP